ncbi:DUF1538 domain-containing protein [Hathewaya histolytica]|uniref:DUF1538 domain-containing protein n=1 Tax=Hathewaya histolytica TaxID=1498 RepID=UPI003B6814F5
MGLLNLLKNIASSARDILPIASFLIIFQVFILKTPIDNPKSVCFGLILSTIGLYCFVQGLDIALIPLGKSVGSNLPKLDNTILVVLFAFIMGYGATLAEPALTSLGAQIEEISSGVMTNRMFTHTVSLGAGFGMSIGMVKILYKIPSTYVIIPMIAVVGILGFFAPERITGVAFDAAGVTTGPVTVPLNMALAIGLSTMIGGSDPLIDGFGIIALSCLGTILAVLLLGITIQF